MAVEVESAKGAPISFFSPSEGKFILIHHLAVLDGYVEIWAGWPVPAGADGPV